MPANGLSTEYLKLNRLGKVPTFEGADGFVLSETIAIAVYRKFLLYSYYPQLCAKDEAYYHSVIPV